MLASRSNNPKATRVPLVLPQLGKTTQQRPPSTDSTQSIDNAYSLEHLFIALRRRIHRIVQTYHVTSFYNALKICARVFRSYASYNLHTIEEFVRLLNKDARDNRKILTVLDQFRLQLSELRHCHSTFEAELLVTTLAMDFHEDQEHQQSLPSANGKFSPRSRFSKFRLQHIRQAIELKSQLKQTNEHLQVLLFDEFNANLATLWNEIPDIALKFEYALQLCAKLFDLETTMMENHPQTNPVRTPPTLTTITPRVDHNQQTRNVPHSRVKPSKKSHKPSAFPSAQVTSASSASSTTKVTNIISSPIPSSRREPSADLLQPRDENLIVPRLEKPIVDKNDQRKLRLLIEQLDKRLVDEESYRQRLLDCLEQAEKKSEQLDQFPKANMLALVMSDNPAVMEYQKALCLSDYKIHKSVADELDIAIRETQHRIDWIKTVRTRAQQCVAQQEH